MNTSTVKSALKEIYQTTGIRLRKSDLFLSGSVKFTMRLKMDVVQTGHLIELVRVPASYLFAHCSLVCAIVFCILWITQNTDSHAIGACLSSFLAVCGFYGLTIWVNKSAKRENPILSYDSQSERMLIASKQSEFDRSDLCFILALSSIPLKAHKPEKSCGELKLIFRNQGNTNAVVLAKDFKGHLPNFDAEILPFAEALGLSYLHADRKFNTGKYTITRIK
ncbi:MAG: hypothetical protein K0U86_16060 [Planctomycetes bacterium]|nr:hypothetical protein [Planctomycetota bacterium]MCH9726415.1 hypothetical protein [Planctomycetota bacterium]MCH9778224.1 hypothetical protein [Planctomycetota bacterium]MDF1745838.1 hypothetical protein [Gimesia sp.]